ncbi:MAG: uracil-DNA glycosylase [Phycisphaeraceae bacterium]|nr:uracil-DNA glycosylase [Phycisphaeraceae bacterium]
MHTRLQRVLRQHALASAAWGVESLPIRPRPAQLPAVEPPVPTPTPARQPRPKRAGAPQSLLDAIRDRYERDAPHAHFPTDHTTIVFGEGAPDARLMFIGEAPGADEDRLGRPFVGRAGQLLDKMITAMGLKREEVYIANVLKTRPPNNDTPTPEQARRCAPYLFAQIAAVQPEAIVTLGLPATRLLLETDAAMARLRGTWASFTIPEPDPLDLLPPDLLGQTFAVMPTYHPAYLLRSYTQENRQKVWSDLRLVMDRLGIA